MKLLPLRYARYHQSNDIAYGYQSYHTNEHDFLIKCNPDWLELCEVAPEGQQWYALPLSHFAHRYPQARQSYGQQWLHLVGFKRRNDVVAMLQTFLEGEGIQCT